MEKNITKIFPLLIVLLSACSTVNQIGNINMVSQRNIDSELDYVLIKSYAGGSKKELKKSKALNIEEAIDQTVRATPGGEFLKNVKIYSIEKGKKRHFAVEGDVWGINKNANFRGFKVGDKVQWTSMLKSYSGIITNLTNDKVCQIKVDNDDTVTEVEYEKIRKIN